MALVRPFFEAYLSNGMNAQMSNTSIRGSTNYKLPPFLAAATSDVADTWALITGGPPQELTTPPPSNPAPIPTPPEQQWAPPLVPDRGIQRSGRRSPPGRQR
jgi:hypothetical protein